MAMDSYATIYFSYSALYKYANSTLRSLLETALRIGYFAFHPVEYGWWRKDKDWKTKTKNVWGDGYEYFQSIDKINEIDKKLTDAKVKIRMFDGSKYTIPKIYTELSKSVHTLYNSRQTIEDNYLPRFNEGNFNKWSIKYNEIMTEINLFYISVFSKQFEDLTISDKTIILDIGLASEEIRKALGI